MKIKFLLLAFAFLVICTKPVGAISLHDNETEISCYVDSFHCEIVTVNILGLNFNYVGDAGIFYDRSKERAGEARAPTIEVSKGYYTKNYKPQDVCRLHDSKSLIRKPRDGLNQLV